MFNVKVDYPSQDERSGSWRAPRVASGPKWRKVLSGKAILNLQSLVNKVA